MPQWNRTNRDPLAGVGANAPDPRGAAKVTGTFEFSSDLRVSGMLWGATVRSRHPHAYIRFIDVRRARQYPGVRAILTHHDLPTTAPYGQFTRDQPVLAADEVRYHGEPIALVAADDLHTARRAASEVAVTYRLLPALTDPATVLAEEAARVHPDGNLFRHARISRGDVAAAAREADVVVHGEYELRTQDPAFLGPESGIAVPDGIGGIDITVATQWLHADQEQIAECLGVAESAVRVWPGGVGGAFGGREDLSVQLHAALLAFATEHPVGMCYSRDESFLGHVHRHPAQLRYTHHARSDGTLLAVHAEILADGGAYASTSAAVAGNMATCAVGPYAVDNLEIDVRAVRTHNPPAGAMRGFGAVQTCFAYEAQMDRIATRLGRHPLDIRSRNAVTAGSQMATGQRLGGPVSLRDVITRARSEPPVARSASLDEHTRLRRGTGWAVGLKKVGFVEGFDDFATAAVHAEIRGDRATTVVRTAAMDVGQGVLTVVRQIAATELPLDDVVVEPADSRFGSAGSSAASRQTYVTGGAVREAAIATRNALLARAQAYLDDDLTLYAGWAFDSTNRPVVSAAALLATQPIECTRTWRHPPTYPLDPHTGQGDSVAQYCFALHEATVEVDIDLGQIHVIDLRCIEDVGRAINPLAVRGQFTGASAQGLGLALMEQMNIDNGHVRTAGFGDYLIPTTLDVPRQRTEILEHPDPWSPYGVRGVGEAASVSSTPAIVAAVRAATGNEVTRVPITPLDLIDLNGDGSNAGP